MMMTATSPCHQQADVDETHEAPLHDRLVAYVHALAPPHAARLGVWGEHSYARSRGAASHVRVLLAPRPPAAVPHHLDPEHCEPRPLPPGTPPPPPSPPPAASDLCIDEELWEARFATLAPGAAHRQLADAAVDTLRGLRLARLAGAHRPERVAARRLRLALSAALAARGGGVPALSWLHGALTAHMPRSVRHIYEDVMAELSRTAPLLAERVLGAGVVPPRHSPVEEAGSAASKEGAPWLLWLTDGSRLARRWRARLGALVNTRAVRVPNVESAAPDAWCAAHVTAARGAIEEALAEAGEHCVVVGGAGACASLCVCACAAGAGRVRGALLLAPPLRTAEGARDLPGDALADLRLPLLLVVGTSALHTTGDVARRLVAQPARRLLEVRGADHALRLPGAHRALLRLEQRALDAAVADECARWVLHAAEGGETGARRPHHDAQPEEYAHLPLAVPRPAPVDNASEGRLVSRGCGATPLALLPPRRVPPPAPELAPADIMRLPIVFADDEKVSATSPDESAVTVTSGRGGTAWRGAAPYTRVIVASRGAGTGSRPLLLRRAVRLVPRH